MGHCFMVRQQSHFKNTAIFRQSHARIKVPKHSNIGLDAASQRDSPPEVNLTPDCSIMNMMHFNFSNKNYTTSLIYNLIFNLLYNKLNLKYLKRYIFNFYYNIL